MKTTDKGSSFFKVLREALGGLMWAVLSIVLLAAAAVMELAVYVYSLMPEENAVGWFARVERDRFALHLRIATALFFLVGTFAIALAVSLSHNAVTQAETTINVQRTQIAGLHTQATALTTAGNAQATAFVGRLNAQATADANKLRVQATADAQNKANALNNAQTCGRDADRLGGYTQSGSWVVVARKVTGSTVPCAVVAVNYGRPFPMGNQDYIQVLPLGGTFPVTVLALGPETVVYIGSHDEVQAHMCANPGLKAMVQAQAVNLVANSQPDFVCK
jgi:hypothetical protein